MDVLNPEGGSVSMRQALRNHWPEYLIEAAGLCLFMLSACAFATLLFHPSSVVAATVVNPWLRRILMGIAMGLTATAIVYSPWGKRSGAHLNPSVTLTFFRLGKVELWDALFYISAQFVGGVAGVLLASAVFGDLLAAPSVNYVTTMPGASGNSVAFLAEMLISFILMSVVLNVSNRASLAHWTGICAGVLIALYISFESPLSGMSMNPARTFGSALSARAWTALWVYFIAPPAGMFLAAHVYTYINGKQSVTCAKLHHRNNERCIFRCGYQET